MFVSIAKHNKVKSECLAQNLSALHWKSKFNNLQEKWNNLVDKINKKGGMDFLNKGSIIGAKTTYQFSDEELRSLLQLVHPDKHGGKQSAITLTQKINSLRNK